MNLIFRLTSVMGRIQERVEKKSYCVGQLSLQPYTKIEWLLLSFSCHVTLRRTYLLTVTFASFWGFCGNVTLHVVKQIHRSHCFSITCCCCLWCRSIYSWPYSSTNFLSFVLIHFQTHDIISSTTGGAVHEYKYSKNAIKIESRFTWWSHLRLYQ